MSICRRGFLLAVPAIGLLPAARRGAPPVPQATPAVPDTFPSHAPALAHEMVAVAHGNVAKVRELLSARPALANATWDWGYGDWESGLGAASHVGNREIARLLIDAGAHPTIFSAAMLGQLDAVRAFVAASPGVQRTRGPHGIPLLAHAKAGGAADVVTYLESLGGAGIPYTDEPVADADRAAIIGTYGFGTGAADRLIVSLNSRGSLAIKREGGVDRNLFHLGSRVFHPPGAGAVRIRFGSGAPAPTLVVEDGALVVTSRRLAG